MSFNMYNRKKFNKRGRFNDLLDKIVLDYINTLMVYKITEYLEENNTDIIDIYSIISKPEELIENYHNILNDLKEELLGISIKNFILKVHRRATNKIKNLDIKHLIKQND